MSFASPVGFFALLGIPAVLVIHLLRVRSHRIPISTLFLLEPDALEREGGRKIDRLRSSPLLWLQLAAVFVMTWLLVEPRWLREDSTLSVVVVVDQSASMSAFREPSKAALARYLSEIDKAAARVRWTVLGSDPTEKTLYAGEERARAIEAAFERPATLGAHDLHHSLSLAISLAGRRGVVVLVTDHDHDHDHDHEVEIPSGVHLLAAGTPVDNVGVASIAVDGEARFRALVKSSSRSRERRRWWIETDGVAGPKSELALEAGEVRFVAGELPQGANELAFVLEPDEFELDDRLPFVAPAPKMLGVHVTKAFEEERFVASFLETLEPCAITGSADADLTLGRTSPRAAIVFAETAPGFLDGPIVVENHPLVEGLDFRGLVARNGSPHALTGDDRVLLWQGERPLLVLREGEGRRTLFVGFPLADSNADRIPAFVLALHRFAESVRRDKRAFARDNVETRQVIQVASGIHVRAPAHPGFFEVRRDGDVLFEGAAHFADVREGDLSQARSREPDRAAARDAMLVNSLPDPFRPAWILVLMGLALACWRLQERGA